MCVVELGSNIGYFLPEVLNRKRCGGIGTSRSRLGFCGNIQNIVPILTITPGGVVKYGRVW